MQRHLHRTIRHLCRHSYRCCLYSTRPALQLEHAERETPASSIPSSDSRPLENTEDSKNGESSAGRKRTSSKALENLLSSSADVGDASSMPNKVDAYLASLRAEGIEPTLADLDRLRPKRMPYPRSPKYAEAYKEVAERLCRTFSKEQLQRFCHELQLGLRHTRQNRRKVEYAESIMEKVWGWENLKELEKQRRDASEVAIKTFPVSASELFLLLGKDGSELLQISKTYNVHISVTPDPLSIRIEGFKASIRKIEALILERRKSIVEETVVLPTGERLSSSLLQQVSRTANAFIENLGNAGKIRIRAMNQQRLSLAKRLALRTSVQVKHSLSTPFAALLPPPPSVLALEESPSSYALFPFTTQRSLPWTDASGSAFRSRRVGEWLGEGSRNFTLFSADLSGRKGKLVGIESDTPGLEEIISRSFRDPGGSYFITASTGHVLITDISQQRQPSILPPLQGRWKFTELLGWMKSSGAHRVFVPCLPTPLHSSPPTQEKIVHRLTYRRVWNKGQAPPEPEAEFTPAEVIRAEVVINRKKLEDPELSVDESEGLNGSESGETILDDLLIDSSVVPDRQSDAAVEMGSHPAAEIASDLNALQEDIQSEAQSLQRDAKDAIWEVAETPSELETFSDETQAANIGDSQKLLDTSETEHEVESSSEPICGRARELELLISLPDRPVDLKMTVLGSVEPVVVQNIIKLDEYFESLKTYLDNPATESTPPEPPLFIEYGEDKYILDQNASVRQSTESLDLGRDALPDFDSPRLENLAERRILTTTESIYDLESGHKLVNCEVACKAAPSSEAWASFLSDIDQLTSVGYKPKHSTPAGNSFSLEEQNSDHDNQLF